MMRATVLVTALLALGAIAGCGEDDKKSEPSGAKTTSTATSSDDQYPAAVEKSFMRGCLSEDGAKRSVCQCAFDKIEETIPYDEFEDEAKRIASGGTPSKRFTSAAEGCA